MVAFFKSFLDRERASPFSHNGAGIFRLFSEPFNAVGDKLILPCVTSCPRGMCNARTPLVVAFSFSFFERADSRFLMHVRLRAIARLYIWRMYVCEESCQDGFTPLVVFTLTGQNDWIQKMGGVF